MGLGRGYFVGDASFGGDIAIRYAICGRRDKGAQGIYVVTTYTIITST